MGIYEELQARGLVKQVTNESELSLIHISEPTRP